MCNIQNAYATSSAPSAALSPSIICAERSIDELRATDPSGPITAKWVPLQTSQKYENKYSHSRMSIRASANKKPPPSDPPCPSPGSRLPLLLPRLRPPPANPQTPRPLQPIPAARHHLLDLHNPPRPFLGFHHEARAAAGPGRRWAGGYRWGFVWRRGGGEYGWFRF